MEKTYRQYLEARYGIGANDAINEFISIKNNRLMFAEVDLGELVERHGAPLEINYCPLITEQIDRLNNVANLARLNTDYKGDFLYAYATKANFSEEVVRTALKSGAHYETSSGSDVLIATELWRQGILSTDSYIFCNGSKENEYIDAILRLRREGNRHVIPIVDDIEEWKTYRLSSAPLQIGIRAREFARCFGGDRFGLLNSEIDQIVASLPDSTHQLVLYHAMVGSQLEDGEEWLKSLTHAVESYCRLRQRVPTLSMFSFGGGMPTSAYDLDFTFDYSKFMTKLFSTIKTICTRFNVPVPTVVGEFGRYTVANHSVYLFEIGQVKKAREGGEPWYLLNGSLMVSIPDILIVPDQKFITLAVNEWDQTAQKVRLGGRRTCDSDDVYPRPGQEALVLPQTGKGLIVAFFGVGAYQQMLSGRGGAHHCLNPEMKRLIIERVGNNLVTHEVANQDLASITASLGYSTLTAVGTGEMSAPRIKRNSHPRLRRKTPSWLTMVKQPEAENSEVIRMSR